MNVVFMVKLSVFGCFVGVTPVDSAVEDDEKNFFESFMSGSL